MQFEYEAVKDFQNLFQKNKEKIRQFEGCHRLELYKDQNNKTIFFTFSYWESELYLNTYRNSFLFTEVRKNTKVGFSQKAKAWSLDKLVELK